MKPLLAPCVLILLFNLCPALPSSGISATKFSTPHEELPLLLNDDFIHDARLAIDLLYNRQYDESVLQLSGWQKKYPGHPVWLLWKALEAWWPVLSDLENTSYDDSFLEASRQVIDSCDRLLRADKDDLDARIIRSITNGQVARFYSNRYRWYRSFLHARRALRDFFLIEEHYPGIPDLNFGMGMYRYFSAYLLEAYPLARPVGWMLPRGDRQEGLERLKMAAEESIFLEPEAMFFLGHIYLHFERQPEQALDYLRDLSLRYPDNHYYTRLYVRSLIELNHHGKAMETISGHLQRSGENNHSEYRVMKEDLLTLRGTLHYRQHDYEPAQSDLHQAILYSNGLHPFGERTRLITALYYLGEISMANGQRELARLYFSRAATPDLEHIFVEKSRSALRKYNLE